MACQFYIITIPHFHFLNKLQAFGYTILLLNEMQQVGKKLDCFGTSHTMANMSLDLSTFQKSFD